MDEEITEQARNRYMTKEKKKGKVSFNEFRRTDLLIG